MMAKQKTYIAIDLKSFYASVECKERNRDPSATCRLPVHEYFQVSGVSKSRLTDNIEKRIIIIRGGISHTNACVGGVDNGSNERLCCPSG